MSKKNRYPNIRLEIDGQHLPAGNAGVLFQKDPYPGGHTYSVSFSGKGLKKLFDYLFKGKSGNISEEDARRFLQGIAFIWEVPAEEDMNCEYFMNSVEEIDFDGEQIKFFGVCSEVIRGN